MTRLGTLGVAIVGGVIAFRCLPLESRNRLSLTIGNWMANRMVEHMGRMMASLPESAPPKLVMSILPKLQVQNEQIIAMLRKQNELLLQRSD
jgi:hypothetical protein